MKTINPANGELIAEFSYLEPGLVADKIKLMADQFKDWAQRISLEERCKLLRETAKILRERKVELAQIITLEMGKLKLESEAEVEKSALVCDFYADKAAKFLAPETIETEASKSYIVYQPLGLVFGVMPWNFPFWQVFRFAAPSLAAGNLVLVKHASNVPQCAAAIEEVFNQAAAKAGLVYGVYADLRIGADQVESVIRNRYIKAVSFTGSEPAGRKIAAIAGSELKKCVLELGGSDAFIVLDNADMAAAIEGAIAGRFQNMGQSCIAAKRFIVDQYHYESFIAKLKAAVEERFVAGDPADCATTLAPMASQKLLEELDAQVQKSVEYGARLVTGGKQLTRPGCYYAPTILADVASSMPAFSEELFGPVAVVMKASEPAHAVGLANATDFGLSSSVWGKDAATCETIANTIEAGSCFINGVPHSDPRLPFGGIKNSGFGRELSSHGIREFCNIKTIWIR